MIIIWSLLGWALLASALTMAYACGVTVGRRQAYGPVMLAERPPGDYPGYASDGFGGCKCRICTDRTPR